MVSCKCLCSVKQDQGHLCFFEKKKARKKEGKREQIKQKRRIQNAHKDIKEGRKVVNQKERQDALNGLPLSFSLRYQLSYSTLCSLRAPSCLLVRPPADSSTCPFFHKTPFPPSHVCGGRGLHNREAAAQPPDHRPRSVLITLTTSHAQLHAKPCSLMSLHFLESMK